MAVTETYVDPATGNDYKGASFTDGAYTSATKTLVKTGAFAASRANHWLALSSNDGGSIVTGFYQIASVTNADTVVLKTDAGAGVDDDAAKCTQADGTSGNPWHSVQGALDLITRNATDGDRINLKAGTADTLSATLSYATYGTPSNTVQLIIQGYTTSAGDGGIGEIDGAATYSICTGWQWCRFIDLKLGNCGSADVLDFSGVFGGQVINCEIHNSSGYGVDSGSASVILGCWFHDLTGTDAVNAPLGVRILYSFFDVATTNSVLLFTAAAYSVVIGNIIKITGADTSVYGIYVTGSAGTIIGNSIFCSSANTKGGIYYSQSVGVILNNIIEGWSGSGGDGIEGISYNQIVGANATYNCANPYTFSASKLNYAIAANDTLSASPFTDAANNDFSINGTVTGVTEDAYPSSFRGL